MIENAWFFPSTNFYTNNMLSKESLNFFIVGGQKVIR